MKVETMMITKSQIEFESVAPGFEQAVVNGGQSAGYSFDIGALQTILLTIKQKLQPKISSAGASRTVFAWFNTGSSEEIDEN